MKVIEITESRMEKMSGLVEDMLLAGGELMHCLTKMHDEMYGERGGSRSGGRYGGDMYGNRDMYGMREHDRMDDDREMRDPMMYGERRRYYPRMR